jgi:hypothetical protein
VAAALTDETIRYNSIRYNSYLLHISPDPSRTATLLTDDEQLLGVGVVGDHLGGRLVELSGLVGTDRRQ